MISHEERETAKWGIIADDLTGACDTGAVFSEKGFATVVVLDRRARLPSQAQIVVLTTNSRNDSVRQARMKVRQACRHLKAAGVRILYKKIDSTLKGHVAAEITALMQMARFSRAMLCPAFPAQGRVVRKGVLWVRGQPLADLISCFQNHRSFHVVSVPRPISKAKVIKSLRHAGHCVVPEAETERDLTCLANAAANFTRPVLLVGSAGMARHVAEILFLERVPQLASRGPCSPRSSAAAPGRLRAPLIFTGSGNAVTETQVASLVRHRQASVLSLDRQDRRNLHRLRARDRPVIVRVPIHQQPIESLVRKLSAFSAAFTRQSVSSIVLIGGDTGSLITGWLATKAIELHGQIAPGVPWGYLTGGKADGIAVCTKAGGFGDAETLIHAVDFLAEH
ncbi:MAG: four-carbon acid sugar kinase family protein [Verrucomicrobia bacterium]|nr:four-carbon acid sugar kinase family protein [Verrucomicrobiota bacterium]